MTRHKYGMAISSCITQTILSRQVYALTVAIRLTPVKTLIGFMASEKVQVVSSIGMSIISMSPCPPIIPSCPPTVVSVDLLIVFVGNVVIVVSICLIKKL